MPAPAPAAMRSIGRCGDDVAVDHRLPRQQLVTTSPQRAGSGCATRSAFNSACACSRRSSGTAAIASRVAATPSFSARMPADPLRRRG